MNFFFSSLLSAGAFLARCVSLVLLPALTSETLALSAPQPQRAFPRHPGAALPPTQPSPPASVPYLTVALPPPLRFQEIPPPADPVAHTHIGAPPHPGGPAEDIASANRESIAPALPPDAVTSQTSSHENTTSITSPSPLSSPEPLGPSSLVTILPDDTPREVRAEDVLPFFQFPRPSRVEEAPGVPAPPTPGQLPPSSARYRQE